MQRNEHFGRSRRERRRDNQDRFFGEGEAGPGTGSLREEEDFHGVVAAKIIAARRAAVIRVMAQEMPEATVGGAAMAKAP
jgi:hypothetical protein